MTETSPPQDPTSSQIYVIADFFNYNLNGGAENNDAVLVQHLRHHGKNVVCLNCNDVTPEFLEKTSDNLYIISNFINLSEECKRALENNICYIIYEHDHKYVNTRDPSQFPEFKIPTDCVVNQSFYEKAKAVVVLSEICKNILEATLPAATVKSIGCSLWSDERLDFIESLITTPKQDKYFIINSPNHIKGTAESVQYCEKNNILYELTGPLAEQEILEAMAGCQYFLFMPKVLETLSRVVVEAKMLGCKVVTRKHMIGAASEDWFDLSGAELVTRIREKRDAALVTFDELLGIA